MDHIVQWSYKTERKFLIFLHVPLVTYNGDLNKLQIIMLLEFWDQTFFDTVNQTDSMG